MCAMCGAGAQQGLGSACMATHMAAKLGQLCLPSRFAIGDVLVHGQARHVRGTCGVACPVGRAAGLHICTGSRVLSDCFVAGDALLAQGQEAPSHCKLRR